MKLYYWEMTSGKRVHGSFCGKGKEKIKKVKGSGGGRDRRLGRAGKVDKGGNGEELQRRKCQEKGEQVSLGEWFPTSTHLCTNPMARVLFLEHNPDFTALLCTNKTSACKIRSKLLTGQQNPSNGAKIMGVFLPQPRHATDTHSSRLSQGFSCHTNLFYLFCE